MSQTTNLVGQQCPWLRHSVRSAHGRLSQYGRQCELLEGHAGLHQVPTQAKQSNRGLWYDPVTGKTITQ